jgi:hypothetical protein
MIELEIRLKAADEDLEDLLHLMELVYPRTFYTDLSSLMCKTPLVVEASGLTAQRITSVAWNRSVGGIVIPRALAVLRLITNSNVMACSTGTSIG